MAFYAEMKRRNWYRVCGINMINEYKRFLYDQWYNSLTEEQKIKLEENKKRREEQRQRELNTELAKIAMMSGMIANLYSRSVSSKYDKYNGIYDEFGFPKL